MNEGVGLFVQLIDVCSTNHVPMVLRISSTSCQLKECW